MKTYFNTAFVFMFLALATNAQTPGKAVVPADRILKNIKTVLQYYSEHLRFEGDFTAFDTHGKIMTKGMFLNQLTTGNYLPLQVYSKNQTWAYELFALGAHIDRDAQSMLKQIGIVSYGIYQILGKPFPDFHYVDINGKTYTSENTKGKIIVLKAWYIGCEPCVAEMPGLNQLVDKYKNRKDIIFISIALDSKAKLKAFTKHTLFKYKIVPTYIDYVQNKLHVSGYPAHWIIDKNGVVVSMSYDHNEMIAALDKEASK
jgi:peroxiredoxin